MQLQFFVCAYCRWQDVLKVYPGSSTIKRRKPLEKSYSQVRFFCSLPLFGVSSVIAVVLLQFSVMGLCIAATYFHRGL